MQEFVVYIIILMAVGWVIYRIVKKMKRGKKTSCNDACGECPLKEACHKKTPAEHIAD